MTQHSDPLTPAGVTWSRVSPLFIRARIIATCLVLLPILLAAVVVAAVLGDWIWALVALPALLLAWVLWLIPRQVRAIGYAEEEDDLLVRRGVLFRSLVVVPYGRMQFTDVAQGPLLRALGLATVKLHTASASTDATIPGLPAAEAARLKDRLTELGESRLAGL
ncbi:PH domain-containing protein [Serinibacter salmoneus]|nr:PH domain-containing protein [Serinibacter salmoneus]